MARNKVDDNQNNTCSQGLHFCSEGYLKHFGGARTVIVKINPRDVVSIPNDYNQTKGRACRYEVIGEVGVNPDDKVEFDKPVQSNANSNTYKPEPKKGSSAFYRGYTDGFNKADFNNTYVGKDRTSYDEGFTKGQTETDWYEVPRYQYVPENTNWPKAPNKPYF
jgi:hypothetical protein